MSKIPTSLLSAIATCFCNLGIVFLAAMLIGATLTGQFEPLTERLLALVTSRRFRERQKRRGYRFGAEP